MGRILAIDYGKKRTGIAVSDPLRIIAGGLETVETKLLEQWLSKYLSTNDVTTIVIGKPMQTTGEESENWRRVEPFVNRIKKLYPQRSVVLWDVRFTSVLAHRSMYDIGIWKTARQDDALVYRLSLKILLQGYMDR